MLTLACVWHPEHLYASRTPVTELKNREKLSLPVLLCEDIRTYFLLIYFAISLFNNLN